MEVATTLLQISKTPIITTFIRPHKLQILTFVLPVFLFFAVVVVANTTQNFCKQIKFCQENQIWHTAQANRFNFLKAYKTKVLNFSTKQTIFEHPVATCSYFKQLRSDREFNVTLTTEKSRRENTLTARLRSNIHKKKSIITMAVDEIGQIQVKFPNGNIDMVRVNAQSWLRTVGIFF